MSFTGPSNYEKFQVLKIKKKLNRADSVEKRIKIEGKIVGVNYYESVYSPMVTCSFLQEDTGGTTSDDLTGFAGTLKDITPIEGFEEVIFQIATGSGKLKFLNRKNQCFIIIGSPFNVDEGQKQTAFFPMVSKNAIKNANKPLNTVYPEAKISDIVKKILKDKKGMNLPNKLLDIEPTKNNMKVDGTNQPPLDTILKLCAKAEPEDGSDPGFFFFETQSGYHFKSIQKMIVDGIEAFGDKNENERYFETYRYSSLLDANLDNDENNYKILKPPVVRRDQDQINAIRNGQYTVRVCTINLQTQVHKEEIINFNTNENNTNLGTVIEIDNNPNGEEERPCKTFTYILDEGSDNTGVSEEISNNPSYYEPRAIMKYGLLHAQLVDIQIPCNVELEAGMVIRILYENITQDNKIEHAYNEHRSGFYLILHLCHHFDTNNSFTSLTLARDGYGLYNSTK
tara:strand:- start:4661 stop:6022 length:1362 start_codon:yes stop_codon:yes gene_type:complete